MFNLMLIIVIEQWFQYNGTDRFLILSEIEARISTELHLIYIKKLRNSSLMISRVLTAMHVMVQLEKVEVCEL